MVLPRANATGLTGALRDSTHAAHEAAESEPFVRCLSAGELPIEGYPALVAQNHAIYSTLERLGDHWRDDPIAGPFVVDELRRVPSPEADLAQLLRAGWRESAPSRVERATRRYTAHLEDVCGDWPAGYVAPPQAGRRAGLPAGADRVLQVRADRPDQAVPRPVPSDARRAAGRRRRPAPMIAEDVVAFDHNPAVLDDLSRAW